MANTVQPSFKEYMLGLALGGTVKVQLIDTAIYTYSASHAFLSSVPVGARVGAAVTLTSKTFANGVFDAADLAFSGLSGAPSIEGAWIYIDTGDEATSRLVEWIDTSPDLPIPSGSPGGALRWDNGAGRIFAV